MQQNQIRQSTSSSYQPNLQFAQNTSDSKQSFPQTTTSTKHKKQSQKSSQKPAKRLFQNHEKEELWKQGQKIIGNSLTNEVETVSLKQSIFSKKNF